MAKSTMDYATDSATTSTATLDPMGTFEALKGCLDNVETNVFVADNDLRLVFANKRAHRTLSKVGPEIRKIFGVSPDQLIGGSIHRFHKAPKQVEAILRDPKALPREASFTFGDDNETRKIGYIGDKRYVRLTITPTGNDSGNIFLAAIALLGHPDLQPTANPPV